MKTRSKKTGFSFFEWIPVLFFALLIYKAPAILIPPLSLYIPSRYSIFLYGILAMAWVLINPWQQDFRPRFWDLLRNLLPVEVVCLLLYMQTRFTYGLLIILLILLALALVAVIGQWNRKLMIPYITNEKEYPSVGRRVIVLVICLILSYPTGVTVCGSFLEGRKETGVSGYAVQSFSSLMQKYQQPLSGLNQTVWDQSGKKERLATLQSLADFQMEFLNTPVLQVIAEDLGENTEGKYVYPDHVIIIDSGFLQSSDAAQAVDLICHESRHAYQRGVVDMLDWNDPDVCNHYYYRNAQRWKQNFEHYNPAETGYEEYAEQDIEKDARSYAANSVEAYSRYLDLGTVK